MSSSNDFLINAANMIATSVPWFIGGYFVFSISRFTMHYLKVKKDLLGVLTELNFKDSFDQATFNTFDEYVRSVDSLAKEWHEFDETLVKDEKPDGSMTIWNTYQAESFFSSTKLIGRVINIEYYQSLPGMFTALGLLGTFLALFCGLAALNYLPSGEIQGIKELIGGLKLKFISSIAGVFCAALFLFAEKQMIASLERKCSSFHATLNSKFDRVVPEKILHDISKFQEQQTTTFKQLNTSLTGKLKDSINQELVPVMRDVHTAVIELTKVVQSQDNARNEQSTEAIERMIEKFQNAVSQGANSEITNLASTLSTAATLIEKMSNQMTETSSFLQDTVETQKNQLQSHNDNINSTITDIIQKLDSHKSEQFSSFQNEVKTIFESLRDGLKQQQEVGSDFANSQQKQFEERLAKINQEYSASLESRSAEMREDQIQLHKALEDLTNNLAESSRSQLSNISSSAEELTSNLRSTSTEVSEALKEAVEAQKSQLTSVSGAADEMRELLESIYKSNEELINNFGSVSKNLGNVSNDLLRAAEVTGKSNSTTSELFEKLREQIADYQRSMTEAKSLWQTQNDFHKNMETQCSNTLKMLDGSIREYSSFTHKALGEHLTKFDSSLSDATNKVATVVIDLDSKLTELTDSLDNALKSMSRLG